MSKVPNEDLLEFLLLKLGVWDWKANQDNPEQLGGLVSMHLWCGVSASTKYHKALSLKYYMIMHRIIHIFGRHT